METRAGLAHTGYSGLCSEVAHGQAEVFEHFTVLMERVCTQEEKESTLLQMLPTETGFIIERVL